MLDNGKILITGAGGFLGAHLAPFLAECEPHRTIILTDIVKGRRLDRVPPNARFVVGDLSDPEHCRKLIQEGIAIIYHLASLVSGGAEKDFGAGLRANLLVTLHLLEACRNVGMRPRFVFASSIATFGGHNLPDKVKDATFQHPQSSYGVAKVIGEQLINDYSRKGYIDGRGVRLPAVVVRDVPNTAVSGYASDIIREPLNGRDYICPAG